MKRKIQRISYILTIITVLICVQVSPVNAQWDCPDGQSHTIFYMYGSGAGQPAGQIVVKDIPQDTSVDGHAVTISGCTWDEMNGHWYLKWVSYWYYELYEDAGLTTLLQPDPGRTGYIGSPSTGTLFCGHITPSVCGNCIKESGEECDDGNTEDGDGCSGTCQLEGPEAFGSISYIWACPADGSCSDADDGVCLKWFKDGHDAPAYDGTAVTLSGCEWDELNGHWYIQAQVGQDERIKLYANYDGVDFTGPAAPDPSRSGYLPHAQAGDLYEGHIDPPSAPSGFGNLDRVWATADESPSGSGPEAYFKWFVAGGDAQDYHGRRVTLVECVWDELNGQWYINAVETEHIKLYANYDGITFSNPAMSSGRIGYIDSPCCTGYFEDGWPAPAEVWVDDDWAGHSPEDIVDGHVFGYDAFATIQDGIDNVSGSTVHVAAGTYAESITIDKELILQGAGSGSDPATNTVITPGPSFPNINIAAGGSSPTERLVVKNLYLDGTGHKNGFGFSGGPIEHVTLQNIGAEGYEHGVQIIGPIIVNDLNVTGCRFSNNDQQGFSVKSGVGMDGLTFTDCEMINNAEAGLYLYPSPSTITNLEVNGGTYQGSTNFGDIAILGPIINATFTGVTAGDSPASALLFYTYGPVTDVDIINSTLSNVSGSSGIAFVNASGGSITDVNVTGCDITNNVNGVSIYEGTSGVSITNSHIEGNANAGIRTMENAAAGSSVHYNSIAGNGIGVLNEDTAILDISTNWWGDTDPSDDVSGPIDYTPWLNNGADTDPGTPGFQADLSHLYVDDDSPQAGLTGRIQEGIDEVSGSTVSVQPGTYNEDINIDKTGLTLESVTEHGAVVNGSISVLNGADDAAVQGFSIHPSAGWAIDVWQAGNVNIANNEIIGQGPSGGANGVGYRHSAPASSGTVSNNVVEDCELGVYVDHDGLNDFRVMDNTFDNNRKAIGIGSGSGAVISGNSIYNSTQMGIEIFKASLSEAHYNDIVGNALGVSNGDPDDDFDATNNWWGADSGPTHATNPTGTGDSITDKVLYDPWIGDPDSTDYEYFDNGNDGTLTVDGSEVYIDMDDGQSGSFGVETETGTPTQGFTGMGNTTGLDKTIVITTDAADGTFIALIQFSYTDAELAAAGIDEDDLRLYYWDTGDLEWKLAVDGNIGGTPQWMGDSAPPSPPLGPDDIGKHGIDKANNIVWAVVDHTTDYSAGVGPVEAWVDDDYTPATPDWHIDRFDNIQDAIDTCAAGAIIHVYDGTYTQDLIVNKADMTIESVNGAATTVIQLIDGVGIDIQSTGSGFTLGGSAGHGLTVLSGGATTFDIQLTNAPSGVEISYNTIDTTGSATMGISVGATGATGLIVDNNSFTAESGDGSIWGPKVVDVTVSSNTFTGPGNTDSGYAVELAGVTGTSSINDNTITGYGMGIAVFNGEGTSGLSILDNDISGCNNGIRLGQYSPSGINGDMTTVTLSGNTMSNNVIGMKINDGANVLASNFVVEYNYFNGNNTDYGLKNEHTTEVVTASFNWWGDNLGPKHSSNPIGLNYGNGDTVSDMVIFQPWLDNGQQPSGEFYIDARADANTEVFITGAAGGHIVGAGRWSQHPDSAYPAFMVVGGYFIDVFVDDDTGFGPDTQIEIRFHYTDDDVNAGLEENTFRMKWWNGTAWQDCSDTGVNTQENYVWVIVNAGTSPNLTQLTGTPFSASGQRVVIPSLSSWGAIALAVLFLAGIFWAMRRRKLTASRV